MAFIQSFKKEFFASEAAKTLNEGQKKFFEAVFSGKNIFLTSEAGAGKTYCANLLVNFFKTKPFFIGVTATTGVAALNVGGSTIHSFCGIGLASEDKNYLYAKVSKNKKAVKRINKVNLLIIDEISMASADLLNKVDFIFKRIRNSNKPFSGVQIILCGDAAQLGFVAKGEGDNLKFFFESEAWRKGDFKPVILTEQMRQDSGSKFAKLLNQLRLGDLSNVSLLESRINAKLEGPIEPVRLFCKNVDVNKYNLERYNQLSGEEKVFYGRDLGDEKDFQFFEKNCPAPLILRLKIGAQVMLLRNIDVTAGLVNGSLGIVEAFTPNAPIVKFSNGLIEVVSPETWELKEQVPDKNSGFNYFTRASRTQIPLRLFYCSTVHKSQGLTLDFAYIDLSESFAPGMAYTALSRVKTLEGLSLAPFDFTKIRANKTVVDFYESLKNSLE